MKRAIKVISVLLCVMTAFSSCGKNPLPDGATEPSTETATGAASEKGNGRVSLSFNAADGLNPFFARSEENKYLFSLIYEPLFALDKNYNAIGVAAESIAVSGTSATVKLKSGNAVRGSSPITAADVVYSFNMAKSSFLYAGELRTVLSATAKSATSVEFTLKYADVFAAGKLTFPVVKEGTADTQTDIPAGSGDWYYLEKKLVSTADSNKTLELCETDTRESARDAFKIGRSDVFFGDLSDCTYTGTAGKSEDICLNNMVYIGFNSANGALNKYVRSAVAVMTNSEEIALSSYEGHAVPAKLPVNPNAHFAKNMNVTVADGDEELASAILDRCGYTKYSNGVRTNGAYPLSLSLLVSNDNRYRLSAAYSIADSLKKIGFSVRVDAVPFAEYSQRIADGAFDMYLGEIKLDGSMDISVFFEEDTPFSKGVDKTQRAATEYLRYRSGEISPAEYYKIFTEFFPIAPVLFRTGYVVKSGDVTLDLSRAPYDIYYNMG